MWPFTNPKPIEKKVRVHIHHDIRAVHPYEIGSNLVYIELVGNWPLEEMISTRDAIQKAYELGTIIVGKYPIEFVDYKAVKQ